MRERPLSPHLSIYRLRYTLVSSIANRITGVALSAGFVLFVYWLLAIARGAEAYGYAQRTLGHLAGKGLLALLLLAFVYHTLAGVRHLIWDLGYGLERRQAQVSAWLLAIVTLVVWAALLFLFFSAGGTR